MTRNDGGPAFPRPAVNRELCGEQEGMSLRDYFAGQALVAIASTRITVREEVANIRNVEYPVQLATECYRIADALLAERER